MEAPDKPQQLLSPRGAMKAAAMSSSGLDGRWQADVASSALCGAWRRGLRGRGVAPPRLVAALLMSRSHLGSRGLPPNALVQPHAGCDISTAIAGHRVDGSILGCAGHKPVPRLTAGLAAGLGPLTNTPAKGVSVGPQCGSEQRFQPYAYSTIASAPRNRAKQQPLAEGNVGAVQDRPDSPARAAPDKQSGSSGKPHRPPDLPSSPPPPPHHTGLNSEQLAAVKDVSAGLVTVSAGPGSGKTRTLVARVLELVQVHSVRPKQIAVLTFTRKAADELRKRLRDALGATAAEEVVLGTFHSLSARLLRQHFQLVDRGAGASGGSRLAGLRKDFRVLEEDEQSAIIIRCLRESEKALGMRHDRSRVRRFKELVSFVKNRTETTQGLAPQQLLEMLAGLAPHHSGLGDMVAAHVTAHGPLMASPDAGPVPAGPVPAASVAGSATSAPGSPSSCLSELHLFLSCLLRYDLALAGHGACDYDDLLGLAVALLQQPAARRAAAANFSHILVDEFQDTNLPQYTLVQLLRSAGASLFVVGDANQSIYTWRGALPDMAAAAAAAASGLHSATPAGQPNPTPSGLQLQGAIVGPEAPDDTAAITSARPLNGASRYPVEAASAMGTGETGAANASTLHLRRNHRSLPHIVAVAERVINQQQEHSAVGPGLALGEPTRLESVRPPQPGAAVAVVTTDSARDEARWVVRQIQAITGWAAPGTQAAGPVQLAPGAEAGGDVTPGMPPCAPMFGLRDVAILYRVNRQARYLEEALQEAGLPYCLPKSEPFWAGEQVRDVAAFLYLAARPLDVTGAMAASLLTRPARGVPGGSAVLSRLRRPSVRMGPGVSSASMGRLLFGDMFTQPQPQPQPQVQEGAQARQPSAGGHGSGSGSITGQESGEALCLWFLKPDVGAAGVDGAGDPPSELVDPAVPPAALAQAVADAMQLLVPPPAEQQERWRLQPARNGAGPASGLDGRSGTGSSAAAASGTVGGAAVSLGGSAPRYMPLPASALRRKLTFTDLEADDPPWMLIVDNEAFPAPLAPPLPHEVCQALGIRPGDAEYDGITFLRDLVVLLQVAPHLGYTPEDLVEAIVRATGYETWLELEQGERRDLSGEMSRLAELRQAAEQYSRDYREAAVAAAAVVGATSGQEAAVAAAAGAVPTVSEFADHVRKLVEAAAQSGTGGSGHEGTHASRHSKSATSKAPASTRGPRTSGKHLDATNQHKHGPAAAPALASDVGTGSGDAASVRLLTLHGSKGLEFPVVFLTGCEDGLLPHSASRNNPIQQREERRLLFVGITRAMDQLYLTWAATRAAHRHRLLPSRPAAEGHLGVGSRRAAHERMPYMSPFVARLLQELHAEGLVVEAAPRPDGCVAVPAARPLGTASSDPGSQPPAPLVAYHDATKARNMSLSSLVTKL